MIEAFSTTANCIYTYLRATSQYFESAPHKCRFVHTCLTCTGLVTCNEHSLHLRSRLYPFRLAATYFQAHPLPFALSGPNTRSSTIEQRQPQPQPPSSSRIKNSATRLCQQHPRPPSAADQREAISTGGHRARRSNRSRRPIEYHPPPPSIAALSLTALKSPGQPPGCQQKTTPWHLQNSTPVTSSPLLSRRTHSTMLRSQGITLTRCLRPARAPERSACQSMKRAKTPMTTNLNP